VGRILLLTEPKDLSDPEEPRGIQEGHTGFTRVVLDACGGLEDVGIDYGTEGVMDKRDRGKVRHPASILKAGATLSAIDIPLVM
jgi:hypothetical protein